MAYTTFHLSKTYRLVIRLLTHVGLFFFALPAFAGLELRDSFPNTRLSIDGWGGSALTEVGTLQTEIPLGATVEQAYLYGTAQIGQSVNDVFFVDTPLFVADAITVSPVNALSSTVLWDVTSIIQDNLLSEQQDWTIIELAENEGAALVVVYSNAETVGNTSVILDGGLTESIEEVLIPISPLNGGDFLVSSAISLGFQPSDQFTNIFVDTNSTTNRLLSQSAGGQDDGNDFDGGLITVGGIGDTPTNPDPSDTSSAASAPRQDNEFYNLGLGNSEDATPFIQPGDTFVRLTLINASEDDNIFALFLNEIPLPAPSAVANVHEPSTIVGLFSIVFLRFFFKRQQQS